MKFFFPPETQPPSLSSLVSFPNSLPQNYLWAFLAYGPVLMLTVLVHELGHCLASRSVGAAVHGILLWPLGGLAFVGHSSSPARDLLVAVAGPLTHLPQLALWLSVEVASFAAAGVGQPLVRWRVWPPSNNVWLALVTFAVQFNVVLFAFNLLLPAYPLDGGRALADLLLICGAGAQSAGKAVSGLGVVVGLVILAYGFWRKMLLTIAVGVWMLFSTFELLAFVVKGRAGEHPLFCFDDGGGGGGAAAAGAPPPPPPPAAAQQQPSQWSFAPQRPAAAAPVPANPFAASTEMTRPNV